MTIRRAQWAQELDSLFQVRFREGVEGRAAGLVGPTLFNMQSSNTGTENVTSAGAIGPDAWDNYENDGQVSKVDFDKYYLKTYTHKEYPVEITVERKLLDDNRFRELLDMPFRLGDSAMVKREFDMASVFNNAFDSSFTGGDGIELCGAHPYSAAKSGTTQSNNGTNALTAVNIMAARQAMRDFTDDAGSPLGSNGTVLLVPNELERTAHEAVGTMFNSNQVVAPLDPASANNTVNPIAGLRVVVWDYLTDANNWFLIDPIKMRQMLDWFDRVPLSIMPKVEDKTIRATWIAYMRYSFGFSSWQWVFGNAVA